MRATLTFDLLEDRGQFLIAVHAPTFFSALLEIDQYCRSELKYHEHTETEDNILTTIRSLIPPEVYDVD